MSDALVHVSEVVKRYGARTVLGGVSLRLAPGETLALLGPSGGGKSTLLRCINALQPFDAGRISVGEHLLGPGLAPGADAATVLAVRRKVGMVFQDFRLFPHLTALENISEAPIHVLREPLAEAHARAQALLERVGLGDRARAYPRELSGGQQQRVAIARSLAMRPECLLCDEITSALDPETKHEVLEVLEALSADGLALLLVTHEIGFARRAAGRVAVLIDGVVAEEGTAADVIDRSENERVRRFFERVMGG